MCLMAHGEILWFDAARGFGFIRPEMGPKDVFVHISALVEAGVTDIATGAKVEFELVQTGDGRLTAQRVFPLLPVKPKPPRHRGKARKHAQAPRPAPANPATSEPKAEAKTENGPKYKGRRAFRRKRS